MEFESQIVKEAAVQVKQPSSHHFLLQAKCCCWVRDNQLHSLNAKWKKATHGSSLQNLAGGIRLQPGNRSKRPQIMFACDQLRHLESKEGMLHVSCQTVSKTQTQTNSRWVLGALYPCYTAVSFLFAAEKTFAPGNGLRFEEASVARLQLRHGNFWPPAHRCSRRTISVLAQTRYCCQTWARPKSRCNCWAG